MNLDINSLLISYVGITGTFLPLAKVSKIDQYVLALVVGLTSFAAKLLWYSVIVSRIKFESSGLDFHNLHQLIETPTHLLRNSATCITLVFTNQPHFVMESGIHSSLSTACHHEIPFAKLNLKVEYTPPMNGYSGTIPELTRFQ